MNQPNANLPAARPQSMPATAGHPSNYSPGSASYLPTTPNTAQGMPSQTPYAPRRIGQRRGPWAVWWLSLLTFGIYYLIWYYKINRDLALFAPHAVRVNPALAVLAQLVPIVGLVSLANTAGRLKAAHASLGSPVHTSGGITVLSAFWFVSQTRYLQRRLNSLWDTAATLHVHAR